MTHFVKLDKRYLAINFNSGASLKVLIYILSFNNQGKQCYQSLNGFANELNESKSSIIRALSELEEKHLISKETHKALEGYKNPFNIYKSIPLSALDEMELEDNPLTEDIRKSHLRAKKGKKTPKNSPKKTKATTKSDFNDVLKDMAKSTKIDVSETESAKNKALDLARKKLIDN